ncbi:plasma-membrane proton-efflux P-type ATPase [Spizellomyces punctatus DAOM BR117]|uniref:Plasma membrane ATPase n=1 Tax=Spizellomyces punctatus (strain DAOM BR117) TaxID=645134 RepID=A0A0L0HPS6_SPIPD|nr:plasma-membrane proton-efflux P-type ATPase [Spizellomyces punctatus DAOM BR117]KND03421.1 plasma-membrane proton-efflux P-type ATPase [Spizellomyces punctatus DAOM BR117]|eukprot:XP_016611460.1 plasma-membrane proton-efflux P-type ATPase [Spizellomyces punctatus DAOM BR117]
MTETDKAKSTQPEEAHVEVTDDIDPELEALLQTPPLEGLTDAQAAARLQQFGPNEIPEKKTNPILKFLSFFGGAISYLLEIAAIVCAVLGNWIDFGILVFVLIANAFIGYYEEAKAESALDALKNTLALHCRAWRNSKLVEVESRLLVPGDIIAIRLGDIIPADCRLLGVGVTGEETEGTLQIDQAALTGESLPVNKGKGAIAYSSSICKQGQMLAVVTKTGINTYIGRAANLISITNDEGHFQKIINHIGNFLIVISLLMVVIIFIVQKVARDMAFKEALKTVLILTIAAIPVGLPTVMSVTMAVGAGQLAKKKVIVKRLTAIEELASVSTLCSDKTGTLTLNELTFDKPYLSKKGNTSTDFEGTGESYTDQDLLTYAYMASEPGAQDAIELAVRGAAEDRVTILQNRTEQHNIPGYKVNGFIPFNPTSKYTEATVTNLETGEKFRTIKGAPPVIIRMVGGHEQASEAVTDFARRGLRALGVARTVDPEMTKFEMVGMISLLDPPRPDSAHTIAECNKLGITVKMITGDQLIIAKEVAHRLGMDRAILDAHALTDSRLDEEALTDRVIKADGFAHVIPEHKYRVVELMQNRGQLVGMTGDGVNDAPALKKANVGIAVEGCTDAARSAADIVLLASGLSTIVDGVKTSRAIFQRMRSYALYRIASTIHFLLFFFISILVFDFTLPDRLVLLIAVLNDAATLVISVDNARISKRPDKWRLGQLLSLSFILGFLLMIISFAHFLIAKYHFDVDDDTLKTIMYLQISSCPHFVIFSTRLPTWFWKSIPSPVFAFAIIGTQIIAMFMSIYGVEFFEAHPIGWGWGVSVMCISLVMFMILDIVKVFVIKKWSFELTARLWPSPKRRAELEKRIARKVELTRVMANWAKARKVVLMSHAILAFKSKKTLAATKANGDSSTTINVTYAIENA